MIESLGNAARDLVLANIWTIEDDLDRYDRKEIARRDGHLPPRNQDRAILFYTATRTPPLYCFDVRHEDEKSGVVTYGHNLDVGELRCLDTTGIASLMITRGLQYGRALDLRDIEFAFRRVDSDSLVGRPAK